MKKFAAILPPIVFALCLAACGPAYPLNGIMNYDLNRIHVELLKTSQEEPLPLCGEDEIIMLLDRLICPGGQSLFKDMKEAWAREDAQYRSTIYPQRRVRRFIGYCYEKEYNIYIDMDACNDKRRFEPHYLDE